LLKDLLHARADHPLRKEVDETIRTVRGKVDEYVNRNVCLVTGARPDGTSWLKSNGRPAPVFAIMEAYEHVPLLEQGRCAVVPGVHPLAWGMAQLYNALDEAGAAIAGCP
jgi:hypothetical protein